MMKRKFIRKPTKAREILRKSSSQGINCSNPKNELLKARKNETITKGTRMSNNYLSIVEIDVRAKYWSNISKDYPNRARANINLSPRLQGDKDNTPVFDEEKEGFSLYLQQKDDERGPIMYMCQGTENKEIPFLESNSSSENEPLLSRIEEESKNSFQNSDSECPKLLGIDQWELESIQEVQSEEKAGSCYEKLVDNVRHYLLQELK